MLPAPQLGRTTICAQVERVIGSGPDSFSGFVGSGRFASICLCDCLSVNQSGKESNSIRLTIVQLTHIKLIEKYPLLFSQGKNHYLSLRWGQSSKSGRKNLSGLHLQNNFFVHSLHTFNNFRRPPFFDPSPLR